MRSLKALTAVFMATTSAGALAQNATPPVADNVPLNQTMNVAPASSDSPSSTAPTASTNAGGIEDIVVTATRREERLQRVPVTVTAITGNSLKSSGIIDTRQLTQVVPGLVGSRNAGVNQPVIRGVGSSGVSGDEANVATYIDGVYQADPYTTNLDLVEIDRIEVLRGPQGTVFGRNATGGLINVITPDPSFNLRGHVDGTYGNLRGAGDYDLRGYVTDGITENMAFDFAAIYKKTDGYIDDVTRGGRLGNDEYYGVRSKLLFKPSDAAQFVLTGEYAHRDSNLNANQLYGNNTIGIRYPGVILPTGPWQATLATIPFLNTSKYNFALQSKFDLGAVNLETTSSYQHGRVNQRQDSASSNINLGYLGPNTQQNTVSQEIRLLSNGDGPLQWLVGGYLFYTHFFGTVTAQTPAAAGPPAVNTSVFGPRAHTLSGSGFAEGTYRFTDTLFLTLGGRYTTERRKFRQSLNGNELFPEQSVTFDKFTYRAALRWQFSPRANIYASYGTGFKSGIYNAVGTSPNPTKPENLKAAEIGVKADPTHWLRANISIYHYNYTDLQVIARDPTGSLYILQNAATAEIYGGEFETTVAPTRDISLHGNFAYTHGVYNKFPLAQGFAPNPAGGNFTIVSDVAGNEMIRAPRTTFNLGADWNHTFDKGAFGASVNVYHSARVYYDFTNNFWQKSYSLLNAQVSYAPPGDRLKFIVSATNLTNAAVFQSLRVSGSATDGLLERPREVKGTIQFRF
ncbi:TonB-dependent receptor [Sphingobium sp. H39-3-25]|uniref:TonB-dependent receptor n=1 Tax=Sphingobium arseniciresistens TaxID=3030834 RepID=UPI0023B89FD0|nr:TonB-dependent receptor [Sphingobium arseniciresistens]